eukprot:TRINITY_DN3093_c0_g1_i1.p1 TRINITY_DN3093_c0_g1~~TRINITY_DN3093_c0_g1_i1.p1  ORF type:complete len:361 (-),score=60.76 TRINITY_DN3093_c0_g1_i1:29-1111(-)
MSASMTHSASGTPVSQGHLVAGVPRTMMQSAGAPPPPLYSQPMVPGTSVPFTNANGMVTRDEFIRSMTASIRGQQMASGSFQPFASYAGVASHQQHATGVEGPRIVPQQPMQPRTQLQLMAHATHPHFQAATASYPSYPSYSQQLSSAAPPSSLPSNRLQPLASQRMQQHGGPVRQEQPQRSLASTAPPPRADFLYDDRELHRQALAEDLWRVEEADLQRRVTMLENLIRRSNEMPALDLAGRGVLDEDREPPDPAGYVSNGEHFAKQRVGPLLAPWQNEREGQAPVWQAPEEGFYTDLERERFRAPLERKEKEKVERWHQEHPLIMALAGDWCVRLGNQRIDVIFTGSVCECVCVILDE